MYSRPWQRIEVRQRVRSQSYAVCSTKPRYRYPFLDEQVIQFVASLPVEIKCDPRLPEGKGDKRFLRQLADSMGLSVPSTFKKRALQFGSRSAKRQLGLVNGTDAVPRV